LLFQHLLKARHDFRRVGLDRAAKTINSLAILLVQGVELVELRRIAALACGVDDEYGPVCVVAQIEFKRFSGASPDYRHLTLNLIAMRLPDYTVGFAVRVELF